MSRVVCRADCLSSTASANVAAYALSAFGGLPSNVSEEFIRCLSYARDEVVSLYSRQTVGIDDDWLTAKRSGFEVRIFRMAECRVMNIFNNQPKSEPVSCLGQKIRDNDRFPRTGHSKQDAMLRSVSEPRPYPDKIASGAIVNCLRPFQVPGEPRGPGNQVRQVGVFGGQIERPVGAKGPSGSRLIEELARVLGNSRVVDDGLPIDRA